MLAEVVYHLSLHFSVSSQLYLSIKNPTEKKLTVQLFSSIGQLVWNQLFDTPGQDELLQIPFSNYPKGVYLLKFLVIYNFYSWLDI